MSPGKAAPRTAVGLELALYAAPREVELWVAHEGADENIALSRHHASGGLLGRVSGVAAAFDDFLDEWPPPLVECLPIFLAALGEGVFVGSNPNLFHIDGSWNLRAHSMLHEGILAAHPSASDGFVLVNQLGCYFIRGDRPERPAFGLCLGPTTCCDFLREGLFAQVCRSELALVSIGPEGAREALRERLPDPSVRTIALVPAELPNELALIGADGLVRRMRVRVTGD